MNIHDSLGIVIDLIEQGHNDLAIDLIERIQAESRRQDYGHDARTSARITDHRARKHTETTFVRDEEAIMQQRSVADAVRVWVDELVFGAWNNGVMRNRQSILSEVVAGIPCDVCSATDHPCATASGKWTLPHLSRLRAAYIASH